MTEKKRGLVQELAAFFLISAAAAALAYVLLYRASLEVAANYLRYKGVSLPESWAAAGRMWLRSLSMTGAGVLFLWLFGSQAAGKVAYVLAMTRAVRGLKERDMEGEVPVEGNDELTELARQINALSASQRSLREAERLAREEREQLVRALSHDIRNPLAAILSRTELMEAKGALDEGEVREYIRLVGERAAFIKDLTGQLLDVRPRRLERVRNGRLLMEQLAFEWEACLEEEFSCRICLEGCRDFAWTADVSELKRIFDNLLSNVLRYGDRSRPAALEIRTEEGELRVIQENGIGEPEGRDEDSRGLGLEGIRRIAGLYQGNISSSRGDGRFRVEIVLRGLELL